jgi:streptogramin lyase
MTAQLKHMILGRRSGTLREAKPISNRPAVVRRGPLEVDRGLRGPSALGRGGCGFGGRARAVLVAIMALLVLSSGVPGAMADPFGQITEFSAGLNPGSFPSGFYEGSIAGGPDGNLWFTDPGTTPAIGRITPSGQITEYSAGLNARAYPEGIAAGPDGDVWFTDQGTTPAIGRITPSGQITEYSYGLNVGSQPYGIALGADGNLWFTDQGTTRAIGRITLSGQITEYSYGHGLNAGAYPEGIAAGPDGNVWFTDRGATGAIGRITPSGQITEFLGPQDPYMDPKGIATGPDGNLWFADQGLNAVGRITPSGQITEFTDPQDPVFDPDGIAAGPDGNLWFTDQGAYAIGQITPSGQITEFSTGLNPEAYPVGITAGPDGDLWFTDADGAIGRIGSGAAPALAAPARVSGAGAVGSAETCQAQWSVWAGYGPMAGLYPFDGYAWLRDGSPIAGQTAATYTTTAADVGHQLACRETVNYPLPFQLTSTTTSATVTIQAAPPPPPPPTPALSALSVSPRTFTLTGRRVGGRCQPATRSNRSHHPCARRATLTVRFTLSTTATVTFAIDRALPGRLTSRHCTALTNSDRRHRACTRLVTLPGTIAVPSIAGAGAFTFTGAIGGHALGAGSYRLLATPASGGHAGAQQQTTFQLAR